MASTYERHGSRRSRPLGQVTAFGKISAVDLKAAHRLSVPGSPLADRNGGRIVNVSGWVAASGRCLKEYAAYYAARPLSRLQGPGVGTGAPRVLVNAVAPGLFCPQRTSPLACGKRWWPTPAGAWGETPVGSPERFYSSSGAVEHAGETTCTRGRRRHLY